MGRISDLATGGNIFYKYWSISTYTIINLKPIKHRSGLGSWNYTHIGTINIYVYGFGLREFIIN